MKCYSAVYVSLKEYLKYILLVLQIHFFVCSQRLSAEISLGLVELSSLYHVMTSKLTAYSRSPKAIEPSKSRSLSLPCKKINPGIYKLELLKHKE